MCRPLGPLSTGGSAPRAVYQYFAIDGRPGLRLASRGHARCWPVDGAAARFRAAAAVENDPLASRDILVWEARALAARVQASVCAAVVVEG